MPHQSSYRVTATVLTAQPVLPVHVTYVTFMAAYTKSSSLATHLFGHDNKNEKHTHDPVKP